jgi:hypothetical protein
MTKQENMDLSFQVKEYGATNPLPHIIEALPEGKRISFLVGDSDTLYLTLKNEHDESEAHAVADYLRKHIKGVLLLRFE